MNTDKKIINAALWFFALCVGVILLTSCSPFVAMPATATPSPAANPVEFFQQGTPIPHYWQLAALDAWRTVIEVTNARAGY